MKDGATVPTRTIASYLLLTPHRVRQLIGEGVLANAKRNGQVLRGRLKLIDAVNAYIRYLRSKADRWSVSDEYTQLKQRRLKAICEREEMLTAELRGDLHRRDDVEFFVTQYFTSFKTGALAIPSRICHALVGQTDVVKINQIVMDAIRDVLTKTSEFRIPRAVSEKFLRSQIGSAEKTDAVGGDD